MHWNPKQVTIHSGILKFNGTKSYHSYFLDDLKHDTIFVEIVIEKMLDDAEIELDFIVIILATNAQVITRLCIISQQFKICASRKISGWCEFGQSLVMTRGKSTMWVA